MALEKMNREQQRMLVSLREQADRQTAVCARVGFRKEGCVMVPGLCGWPHRPVLVAPKPVDAICKRVAVSRALAQRIGEHRTR